MFPFLSGDKVRVQSGSRAWLYECRVLPGPTDRVVIIVMYWVDTNTTQPVLPPSSTRTKSQVRNLTHHRSPV